MKGWNAVFVVESVMAVSETARQKRESQHMDESHSKRNGGTPLFAEILGVETGKYR